MSSLHSIAINAAQLWAGNAVGTLIRIGYVLLLVRLLGPERYGLLAYGLAWTLMFLPLANVGIGSHIARLIGAAPKQSRETLRDTWSVCIALSILLAVVAATIGVAIEHDAAVRWLVLVCSMALFSRSVAIWCDQVFVAHQDSRLAMRLSALHRPAEVAVGALVLIAGGGPLSIAVVYMLSWSGQAVHGLAAVSQRYGAPSWAGVPRTLATLVALLPVGVAGLLMAVMFQAPIVAFRRMGADDVALGQLALAMQIVLFLTTLPISLASAALPVLSGMSRPDGQHSVAYAASLLRVSVLFGTACGVGCLVLAPSAVALTIGPAFEPMGRLLGLAAWLLIPFALALGSGNALVERGRYGTLAVITVASAVVLFAALPALAEHLGAEGVIVATALGFMTSGVLRIIVLRRLYGVNLRQWLTEPLALAALTLTGTLLLSRISATAAAGGGAAILVVAAFAFNMLRWP